MANKKIGVILSGCGVYDGAEIHEAVATMVALEKHDLEMKMMAPDIDQMHVINHLKGEVAEGETRNVLVEAARIARGNITALSVDAVSDVDGIIFVGGFGAAKNLSNYAVEGAGMQVDPTVETVLKAVKAAGKPIGALCIAPVILAKILGEEGPTLTIGNSAPDAENLEKLGATHQMTGHEEVVVDKALKLVTSPCYMLDATITNIINGADKLVGELRALL